MESTVGAPLFKSTYEQLLNSFCSHLNKHAQPRSILHALSGDQALLLIQATIINRL